MADRKLNEEEWKNFLAALDKTPSGLSKLDALLKRASPFQEDENDQ